MKTGILIEPATYSIAADGALDHFFANDHGDASFFPTGILDPFNRDNAGANTCPVGIDVAEAIVAMESVNVRNHIAKYIGFKIGDLQKGKWSYQKRRFS